ncbi:MAG: hypothetical protein QOE51_1610 [Actinoplanes sp.]|nr:hypothetical protein [Actinoplanes sp.]
MTETADSNGSSTSSIPRRTLGIALRRAREATKPKITMELAARELEQSVLSVRRIEQGTVSTPKWKVEKLCTLYGVPEQTQHSLVALAAKTKATQGWWHSYGDVVPGWFELFMALEMTASRMRHFEPLLVPGLLQVSLYMDHATRADRPELTDQEVAARIGVKRERQTVLTRTFPEPPTVEVILSEAVLLAEPPVEDAMRQQVWHLIKAATELDHVTVRVLPLRVGPHRASVTGTFTLLDFPGDNGSAPPPSTVYAENLTGAIYLDNQEDIDAYEEVWDALDALALDQSLSIDYLSRRLKELTDGT